MYPYLPGGVFAKLPKLIFLATVFTGFLLIALKVFLSQKINEKIFVTGILFSIYFSIYIFFQSNYRPLTIQLMIVFMILLFYYQFYEKDNKIPTLFLYYKDIIFVLAAISFVLWLSGSVLHILPPYSRTFTTWSSDGSEKRIINYYYLYFECQASSVDGVLANSFARNTSIFTEGPMASFHYSLAFLIEVLFAPNKKKYKIVLLFVSIVTSLSSTGWIVLVMFFFLMYMLRKAKSDFQKLLKIGMCVLLAIGALVAIILLVLIKSDTGSGKLRVDDYIVCVKAWMDHPIFGIGIGNNVDLIQYMDFWRLAVGTGLSNSPGQILANGGLWIFTLYLYAIVRAVYLSIKNKDKNTFVFIALFSFMFLVTVLSYNYMIFYIFIWFGAGKIGKSKINIKNILYDLKGK